MHHIFHLCNYCNIYSLVFRLTSTEVLTLTLDNPAFRDNRIPEVSRTFSPSKLCEMMKLYRKQKKMCRRGRGTAHALMEAIRTSVLECQYQFKDERWNCSLEEPYRQNILKKGTTPTHPFAPLLCVRVYCISFSAHIKDRRQ